MLCAGLLLLRRRRSVFSSLIVLFCACTSPSPSDSLASRSSSSALVGASVPVSDPEWVGAPGQQLRPASSAGIAPDGGARALVAFQDSRRFALAGPSVTDDLYGSIVDVGSQAVVTDLYIAGSAILPAAVVTMSDGFVVVVVETNGAGYQARAFDVSFDGVVSGSTVWVTDTSQQSPTALTVASSGAEGLYAYNSSSGTTQLGHFTSAQSFTPFAQGAYFDTARLVYDGVRFTLWYVGGSGTNLTLDWVEISPTGSIGSANVASIIADTKEFAVGGGNNEMVAAFAPFSVGTLVLLGVSVVNGALVTLDGGFLIPEASQPCAVAPFLSSFEVLATDGSSTIDSAQTDIQGDATAGLSHPAAGFGAATLAVVGTEGFAAFATPDVVPVAGMAPHGAISSDIVASPLTDAGVDFTRVTTLSRSAPLQGDPALACDETCVVSWVEIFSDAGVDERDLFVRRFSLDGGWLSAPHRVPSQANVYSPTLVATVDGMLLAWMETREPEAAVMFTFVDETGSAPAPAVVATFPQFADLWPESTAVVCAAADDAGVGHVAWAQPDSSTGSNDAFGASLQAAGTRIVPDADGGALAPFLTPRQCAWSNGQLLALGYTDGELAALPAIPKGSPGFPQGRAAFAVRGSQTYVADELSIHSVDATWNTTLTLQGHSWNASIQLQTLKPTATGLLLAYYGSFDGGQPAEGLIWFDAQLNLLAMDAVDSPVTPSDAVALVAPSDSQAFVARSSDHLQDPAMLAVRLSLQGVSHLLKSAGTSCALDAECGSSFCAGVCCNRACNSACSTCSADAGAPQDGTCAPKTVGIVCRPAAMGCDAPEVCDGTGETCPADVNLDAGTVCNKARDTCELDATCDGVSMACPLRQLQDAGVDCMSAVTTCAAPGLCDGTTPTCPAIGKAAQGTPCRPAAGACDVAEVCDGTSNMCPLDLVTQAGVLCGDAGVQCYDPATCDGQRKTCSPATANDTLMCTLDTGDDGACISGTCVESKPKPQYGFGCTSADGLGALLLLSTLGALHRRRKGSP